MAQFVQLQSHLQEFRQAGIAIVALTYDSPEDQQAFVDKHGIEYPFLSDIDAFSVRALGILNEDYAPGDDNYGIPHPGIFILDADLNIRGKIFVDGYNKRVSAEGVLDFALKTLAAAD